MAFTWSCPYCGRGATVTNENHSSFLAAFNDHNVDGNLCIVTKVTTCPNADCRQYEIKSALYRAKQDQFGQWLSSGAAIMSWSLRPQSSAKTFPAYIPSPILQDYEEACAIAELSPKASATLSRRCLQGMIRDFWGVSKSRLVDEVNAIETKVDPLTWKAIDAVRGIGNIGAHMEKDINLVIDVDPGEAAVLIGLLEVLLKDWYMARHEREEQLKSIVDLGASKAAAKKATPSSPSS